MSIMFKPSGSVDIATDPSDLPAENVNGNLISTAMQRCKNFRLDDIGVIKTRHGSQKLNTTGMVGVPEFIFENSGDRYVFTNEGNIYKNEIVIAGGQCVAPTVSPGTGEYAASQTVTMSTTTPGADVYYTTDGADPDESSLMYTGPVTVNLFTQLKAVSIRSGFTNSDITRVYYSATDAQLVTESNQDTVITETDEDNVVNEGID